ncbi:hypothetical protein ACPC0Q_26890 [Bacillus bombysepticus]
MDSLINLINMDLIIIAMISGTNSTTANLIAISLIIGLKGSNDNIFITHLSVKSFYKFT